jgi:hypothetical protein
MFHLLMVLLPPPLLLSLRLQLLERQHLLQ